MFGHGGNLDYVDFEESSSVVSLLRYTSIPTVARVNCGHAADVHDDLVAVASGKDEEGCIVAIYVTSKLWAWPVDGKVFVFEEPECSYECVYCVRPTGNLACMKALTELMTSRVRSYVVLGPIVGLFPYGITCCLRVRF